MGVLARFRAARFLAKVKTARFPNRGRSARVVMRFVVDQIVDVRIPDARIPGKL
jgi:hypothetical protein